MEQCSYFGLEESSHPLKAAFRFDQFHYRLVCWRMYCYAFNVHVEWILYITTVSIYVIQLLIRIYYMLMWTCVFVMKELECFLDNLVCVYINVCFGPFILHLSCLQWQWEHWALTWCKRKDFLWYLYPCGKDWTAQHHSELKWRSDTSNVFQYLICNYELKWNIIANIQYILQNGTQCMHAMHVAMTHDSCVTQCLLLLRHSIPRCWKIILYYLFIHLALYLYTSWKPIHPRKVELTIPFPFKTWNSPVVWGNAFCLSLTVARVLKHLVHYITLHYLFTLPYITMVFCNLHCTYINYSLHFL